MHVVNFDSRTLSFMQNMYSLSEEQPQS